MGYVPERIPHIGAAAKFLGNSFANRIEQLAVHVCFPPTPFQTVPEFEHLRATAD